MKKLVLLVEDHQSTGENMKLLLEYEDFEVIWATNTLDALKAFDSNKDQLTAIVLDGYLENTSRDTTIPLIVYMKAQGFSGYMLAASSSSEMRREMMVVGCTDHCPKEHFLSCLEKAKI
jgi:DNA-binding response OmpR family regulator